MAAVGGFAERVPLDVGGVARRGRGSAALEARRAPAMSDPLRWLITHPNGWIVILLATVGVALLIVIMAVFD